MIDAVLAKPSRLQASVPLRAVFLINLSTPPGGKSARPHYYPQFLWLDYPWFFAMLNRCFEFRSPHSSRICSLSCVLLAALQALNLQLPIMSPSETIHDLHTSLTAANSLLWLKNGRCYFHFLTFISICHCHGSSTSLYMEPALQSPVHVLCCCLCFCGQR